MGMSKPKPSFYLARPSLCQPASCPLHISAIGQITFLFDDEHGEELIRPDLVEADSDAQLQRRPEIKRAPQQQTRLRGLRRVQLVERAVAAAAAVVRSVRAEARVAEFLATAGPMNQEPEGGPLGPLPVSQFGSPDSRKAPSRASIAAFTATAWWMIGTSLR
ncbi:MAG: hypothetical protein KatS3mg082_1904 [Nitrospiraceae bacterium]|nr:MAG: hypothetical protein KatS3mg082_1904 [Nitrospiraceae bacterium]